MDDALSKSVHNSSQESNKLSNFKATEGKGYVSLSKMREAGPIPDFIEHENADGTGRFCIAAFHQMHCLVRLNFPFDIVLPAMNTISDTGDF